MGLELLEITMAVEDDFKIALSDTELYQCDTVGKMVDLIHNRLKQTNEAVCPSQVGFYMVRRELMAVLGARRGDIRPETSLDELLGGKKRIPRWNALLHALTGADQQWPALVRPRWLVCLVVATIPCFYFLFWKIWPFLPMSFLLTAAGLMTIVLDAFLVRLRTRLPKGYLQVKDLIKLVRTLDSKVWTKDEVFSRVRKHTVEHLGVKESDVTLDARFVADLGAG